jgi:hypothetical protein
MCASKKTPKFGNELGYPQLLTSISVKSLGYRIANQISICSTLSGGNGVTRIKIYA